MSLYVNGVLWVLGAALVGAGAAAVVRKIGHTEGKADNNESVGQVFTIVGGLQAVIIAFVLISLFDRANAASDGSYREANNAVAVAWAADALPEPTRSTVTTLAHNYLDIVASKEWPRMRDRASVGDTGRAQLDRIRAALNAVQTTDDWQLDRKTEAANRLWDVYQARQDRLNAARGGVSTIVWFALITGGLMAFVLPLMFGGTRPAVHIVIVATLAGTMALLLFATYQLQNPYSGGAHVDPTAFESAVTQVAQ